MGIGIAIKNKLPLSNVSTVSLKCGIQEGCTFWHGSSSSSWEWLN